MIGSFHPRTPRAAAATPCYRGAADSAGGFTLVELLVVIGCIGILLALALAGLSRAKGQASGIRCLANLKQFAYAWGMYCDDHDDIIPPNGFLRSAADVQGPSWVQGRLLPSHVAQTSIFTDWPDNTNTWLLTRGLLGPYLGRSVEAWRCPMDFSTCVIRGQVYRRVRSYTMNGNLDSNYTSPNGHIGGKSWRRSELREPPPGRLFIFMDHREDSIEDGTFLVDTANSPEAAVMGDVPRHAHSGGATVSFADQHAELHKWRDRRSNPVLRPGEFVEIIWRLGPPNPDIEWLRERTLPGWWWLR